MIAQALRLHETSIQRHISEYLNNGKLMPENGGSDSHLSEEQASELITYLTDNLLPTTHAIIALADEWWDVRYTVAGMTKWLHRNGFSYRKPAGVPYKFSAEAQQAFMDTYEKLKQEVGDDEPILFIGGVHPTQGTKLAYGGMPVGEKAHVVETTGSRTPLNIMGALNLNNIASTETPAMTCQKMRRISFGVMFTISMPTPRNLSENRLFFIRNYSSPGTKKPRLLATVRGFRFFETIFCLATKSKASVSPPSDNIDQRSQ
ncbi:Transposase and inactivated derivatives [Serratia proteamaculans]|nr:Transposase and inactivated derivatives [Serratia proteamaculans]